MEKKNKLSQDVYFPSYAAIKDEMNVPIGENQRIGRLLQILVRISHGSYKI